MTRQLASKFPGPQLFFSLFPPKYPTPTMEIPSGCYPGRVSDHGYLQVFLCLETRTVGCPTDHYRTKHGFSGPRTPSLSLYDLNLVLPPPRPTSPSSGSERSDDKRLVHIYRVLLLCLSPEFSLMTRVSSESEGPHRAPPVSSASPLIPYIVVTLRVPEYPDLCQRPRLVNRSSVPLIFCTHVHGRTYTHVHIHTLPPSSSLLEAQSSPDLYNDNQPRFRGKTGRSRSRHGVPEPTF